MRWGDYPGLSRWVLCTHKVPYIKERQEAHSEREKIEAEIRRGKKNVTLLALWMEEGNTSQEMQAAFRSFKGQGNRFLPRASGRNIGQMTP